MESILHTVFNTFDCITLGFTPLKYCSTSPGCLCLDHLAQETMDLITKPFQVEPGWVRLCSSLGMGFAALSNPQDLLAFFSITHIYNMQLILSLNRLLLDTIFMLMLTTRRFER